MKIFEIKALPSEDLQRKLIEETESLENLRFQKSIGQLENFKAIQNTKRLIARLHTILKEREQTKSNKNK
jgi:large subunit ribosomal protein L29